MEAGGRAGPNVCAAQPPGGTRGNLLGPDGPPWRPSRARAKPWSKSSVAAHSGQNPYSECLTNPVGADHSSVHPTLFFLKERNQHIEVDPVLQPLERFFVSNMITSVYKQISICTNDPWAY